MVGCEIDRLGSRGSLSGSLRAVLGCSRIICKLSQPFLKTLQTVLGSAWGFWRPSSAVIGGLLGGLGGNLIQLCKPTPSEQHLSISETYPLQQP